VEVEQVHERRIIQPLKPVSIRQLLAVSLGLVWLFYLLRTSAEHFILLDWVNLVFHEAGHPLVGLFSERLAVYGGTFGQLVMPSLALGAFWRQGDTLGLSVGGVWLFENFLNIARYMADAQVQQLPLVGGGDHDWTEIFSRWGLLASDTSIASAVSTFGWIGMLAVWGWLIYRTVVVESVSRTSSVTRLRV
jgi:hypothetical protein